MPESPRPARWVYFLIAGIALVEPATHLWLKYGLTGDAAHSGLHIGDTPFFLTDMRIFTNGFFSPYVPCGSSEGSNNPSLFALPHHWVYGALGWIAHQVHLDPFLALGFANGLAGAFYLWMALRFFRYVIPDRANLAFVLLCCGGGIGGLVWLGALPLGMHGYPQFESWFHRFARYELIEGPFLLPSLVMPRLYYTIPMGIGFAALMAFIDSTGRDHPIPGKKSMLLQFLCTYLNARVGMLFWGVALCFVFAQPVLRAAAKWRYASLYLVPTAVAAMLVSIPFGLNIHGAENVALLLRRSAWIASVCTATFWLLPVAALALWRHIAQLRWPGRIVAGACLGYGCAYMALYLGHQTWYGNWNGGGDAAAAVAVSDWAFLGVIPGMLLLRLRRHVKPEEETETWVALWFLGLGCVSITAFGQGWFMRAMPERGLALLGPPLAMLAAEGIALVRQRFPRLATGYTGLVVASGFVSVAVGALCFQGPLGYTPGRSPYGEFHSEVVLADDVKILDWLERGTLLAPASLPPLLGDVAVARSPELKTLFGQPSLEFGDVSMLDMAREIQFFYSREASDLFRAEFVDHWCIDFVFCPATRPVDPEVIEALKALPWLERIAQVGDAVLFRVLFRKVGESYA